MSDYYELRDYLRQLTAPKPAPIKVEPMSIAELPARARTILDGVLKQPRIDPVVRHEEWRKRKVWTAPQAAWLALGIDPATIEPWQYPRDREAGLRAICAALTDALQGYGLDRGSPDDFDNVLKELGIHLDWMSKSLVEPRQQAILDAMPRAIEGRIIDPMNPQKNDKQRVFNYLDKHAHGLMSRSVFDSEWQNLREQGKIGGNNKTRTQKRPASE